MYIVVKTVITKVRSIFICLTATETLR